MKKKKGQLGTLKLYYARIRKNKDGPQESIVHILTLHLCKGLFSRLKPGRQQEKRHKTRS